MGKRVIIELTETVGHISFIIDCKLSPTHNIRQAIPTESLIVLVASEITKYAVIRRSLFRISICAPFILALFFVAFLSNNRKVLEIYM
jgi:hypothetical protein